MSNQKINGQIDEINKIVDTRKQNEEINQFNGIINQGDLLIEKIHKVVKIAVG